MTQERTCIVCRKKAHKSELIRIVRSTDGDISVDRSGSANGRGCYICRDKICIRRLRKSGALSRGFRCSVDNSVYQRIEEELSEL